MTSIIRHAVVLGLAASLAGSALLAPGAAHAASAPACHASVSNSTPRQYTTVHVYVRTAAHAKVRTVAHYKTTTTTHRATAGAKGRATVDYRISDATANYRVWVDVTVTKHGHSRTCTTSFTPHK